MVTGVLAIQGDFAAHAAALARVGVETRFVRTPADLEAVDALVFPGGESTAMLHGILRDGLEAPLASFLSSGRPVFGTCAGAILLARHVTNPPQRSFGVVAVDVVRNAYGTQLDSFEAPLEADGALAGARGVFIRAPRIIAVGPRVEVLARVGGDPVLVREGHAWLATFHPEMTDDERVVRAWLGEGPVRRAA